MAQCAPPFAPLGSCVQTLAQLTHTQRVRSHELGPVEKVSLGAGLPYVNCTWESVRTLLHDQSAIRAFYLREATPSAHERKLAGPNTRPPRSNFRKLEQSPVFKGGNTLRAYQLEGLNWLLFSWYTRRSVMLADEMGLGKTVQSVSTLNHIWKEEGIRGPFLVVSRGPPNVKSP